MQDRQKMIRYAWAMPQADDIEMAIHDEDDDSTLSCFARPPMDLCLQHAVQQLK